tara:strand:+ start:767 stop:1057 length:291 start_codon:yes stop_codon:yes gene_type:complete
MNREDIFRMAQEAGFEGCAELTWESVICTEELETFAKLVAEHEREACIKACEQVTVDLKNYASAFEGVTAETKFVRNIGGIVGEPFIDAIRARGQA